jgi:hypothetical protein
MAKWQNPRMSLALYNASAAISILRMVVMSVYIFMRALPLTSVSSEGGSQRWLWNESSWSLTVNVSSIFASDTSSVLSADVCSDRIAKREARVVEG